jgi:MscS family membrane protein
MKLSQPIIRYTAMLFTAALVVLSASAKEVFSQESTSTSPNEGYSSVKEIAENPLRPADTTSPRDTLQSFLKDFDTGFMDWQRQSVGLSQAGYEAYRRFMSTLDFSTTPDSDSIAIRVERALLLCCRGQVLTWDSFLDVAFSSL